jgi:ribonuclease VapC
MPVVVIDTSAILAIYFNDPLGPWAIEQLAAADRLLMSTVNLTECLIRLYDRHQAQADEYERRLLTSSIEFVAPDVAQAAIAARARVLLPLNFGDCFAYALAKAKDAALLTLDRDFRAADVMLILPPGT